MQIHRNASAMSRTTLQDTHSLKEGLGQFDFLICCQSETGAPRELTFTKHLTSLSFVIHATETPRRGLPPTGREKQHSLVLFY